MAPTKALCNEVYSSWRQKFETHNLAAALITGDADNEQISDLGDLHQFQIAVTTPEKWDSMTRKWRNHYEIAKMIRLVLIDEIHLVGNTDRGPTLEAIVSRFKSIQNDQEKGRIRFIAVSASLPNIEDISKWINFGDADDLIKTFRLVIVLVFRSLVAIAAPPFKIFLSQGFQVLEEIDKHFVFRLFQF